jgi:AcrR family transcriptional regulator
MMKDDGSIHIVEAERAPQKANSTGRRARRRSLSADEFLRKALEVFHERGFEGTSIDAITAAAGIAKRTIYARYGDKENLFKAAIEQAIDEWNLPIERLRAAECDDFEESLLAIGQLLIDNILTPAGLRLLKLTNAESGRMPAMGEHSVRYGEDPIIAYLADLFERRLPTAFGDATDAAEAFLHLVVGGPANSAAWGVVRDKATIARQARLSIRIFLHGLVSVSRPPDDRRGDAALAEIERVDALLTDAIERLQRVKQASGLANADRGDA